MCGFTDPDNRRTYPWGKEDKELLQFHKDIIRIHKGNQALRNGSIKYIDADYHYLAYGRFNKEESHVILVNNNFHEITKTVTVWEVGVPKDATMVQLMETTDAGYSIEPKEYPVTMGKIKITLPKTSAVILKWK